MNSRCKYFLDDDDAHRFVVVGARRRHLMMMMMMKKQKAVVAVKVMNHCGWSGIVVGMSHSKSMLWL